MSTGLAWSQTAIGQTTTAASADAKSSGALTTVIVTGTRQTGLQARDSAAPVQVIDAGTLQRVGQSDLVQAIAQTVPSFTAQATGADTANLTLSARLRGLSPNNTLVLIDGKRRHGTANLAVLNGPYQGSAAADLNFIPVASIDHIEVLLDGAAAQYGSDAIAGVVNVILKNRAHGGSASVTGGGYLVDGGGHTGDASVNVGFAPAAGAFVNLTAETRYHGHSDRGGIDPRVDPIFGRSNLAAKPIIPTIAGYPHLNHTFGDAAYHLKLLSANAGLDLDSGVQLYAVGTYGRKDAEAIQNYRLPGVQLPASVYPFGFDPKETIGEDDDGLTLGLKGKGLAGWDWDLSTTYGRDRARVGTRNSGNPDLYAAIGSTPFDFEDGGFAASQWTSTLDLRRRVDIGWATPLNLAVGGEFRRDRYEIFVGDAASRFGSGASAFPGFQPTDAGSHARRNRAAYVDVAGSPIDALELDAAVRHERFSDFGSATVGKLTGRYEPSPTVAIRGTLSNGFRAPTLAEEHYSATNVSPVSAFVQLPPNSPGAALVGIHGLKPEKSRNLSLGLVLNPAERWNLTIDAYQILIHDRIVGSGALYGAGGAVNAPAVTQAIIRNGNVLDPTVAQTGIQIFSNAVDTRSRGVDVVLTHPSDFGHWGRVDWTVAANYNIVKVTRINQSPAALLPQRLLDPVAIADLTTASPRFRVNLGGVWKVGDWTVSARETVYGPSTSVGTEDGGSFYPTRITTKALTDLDVAIRVSHDWSIAIGANNLFNQYPNKTSAALLQAQRAAGDNTAVVIYPRASPFGINGGYYYARATYSF